MLQKTFLNPNKPERRRRDLKKSSQICIEGIYKRPLKRRAYKMTLVFLLVV